jgi:hypothetical protein
MASVSTGRSSSLYCRKASGELRETEATEAGSSSVAVRRPRTNVGKVLASSCAVTVESGEGDMTEEAGVRREEVVPALDADAGPSLPVRDDSCCRSAGLGSGAKGAGESAIVQRGLRVRVSTGGAHCPIEPVKARASRRP